MSWKNLQKKIHQYISPVQTLLYADQTIEEALFALRHKEISDKIIYFYVVDRENRLVGVAATRTLLLSDPKEKIRDVMQSNMIYLFENQNLQEALKCFQSHHLLALPVVDVDKHFLGIINVQVYFEEQLDVAYAKRRYDIFQMLGFYLEEGKKLTPLLSYRNRMPWIFCNMFGGIACAVISNYFEIVLSRVLILAMFIPLVLSLSESISMQSMTQSLQSLRQNNISWRNIFATVFWEAKLLILLALTCGIIVGAISLLWGDGVDPALSIMLGIIISVSITGSIAALLPQLLHKFNFQPHVAAGPIVLMCADITTTFIYLGLSSIMLL